MSFKHFSNVYGLNICNRWSKQLNIIQEWYDHDNISKMLISKHEALNNVIMCALCTLNLRKYKVYDNTIAITLYQNNGRGNLPDWLKQLC